MAGQNLTVFIVILTYLTTNTAAKPVEEDANEAEKLEMLSNDMKSFQINSLAYPDEDDLPTTLTPFDADENSFSVENTVLYSTTTYAPEDALKSLLDNNNPENEEEDEESINEERQHEILIVVTQTTTATILTFVMCFLIICLLLGILSLCLILGKTHRPMTVAVQPANNNNATLIATKMVSTLDGLENSNYKWNSSKSQF